MADTYGTFTFTQSDDAVINEVTLVRALNNFVWAFGGGKWVLSEPDGGIYFNEYTAQYPTIDPQMIRAVNCYCEESEEEYRKTLTEMTDEDWECVEDYDCEDCELKDIKTKLLQEVKAGWIEIAFSSNEKQHYVAFGSIRVNANGVVTRRHLTSGYLCGSSFHEENA